MSKHDAAYQALQKFMNMNEVCRSAVIGYIKGLETGQIICSGTPKEDVKEDDSGATDKAPM